MTAFWIILAMSVGVMLGFGLFAALAVSQEEQRKGALPPVGMHPLESDSRF